MDTHGCVAVIGYPKSGKSTTVSEYARSGPANCVWLEASRLESGHEFSEEALRYQLAHHFGLQHSTTPAIQQALKNAAVAQPILLVLDDAHQLASIKQVAFLKDSAEASGGRIHLLLVGVDEPDFLEQLRSDLIPEWRLTGLEVSQAIAWFQQQFRQPSPTQQRVIEAFVTRTDGHPGMLKLAMSRIAQLNDEAAARLLEREFLDGLGSGLAAFQSHLAKRFRETLSPKAYELCRRVSISLRAFRKRLAKCLWELDHPASEFPIAWDDCVLRVFEQHPGSSFALPLLYVNAVQDSISTQEKRTWFRAAGRELSQPENGVIDPWDAIDSVTCHARGSDFPAAFQVATGFLVSVGHHQEKVLRALLLMSFDQRLSPYENTAAIPPKTLIPWLAITLPIHREFENNDRVDQSSQRLRQLLDEPSVDAEKNTLALGWVALIVHGVATGDVALSQAAASRLETLNFADILDDQFDWLAFLVLSAHLNARANLMGYLEELSAQGRGRSLWPHELNFEFWTFVGTVLHSELGKSENVRKQSNRLKKAVDGFSKNGEKEVSLVLGVALSRIQIDHLRDFQSAWTTANRLLNRVSDGQPDLKALVYHARGNAARCQGSYEPAERDYREALSAWPSSNVQERAESHFMLGICLARQENYSAAIQELRTAECLYRALDSPLGDHLAIHAQLEIAAAAINRGCHAQALRYLVSLHRTLQHGVPTAPAWVALGQMAWHIGDLKRGINSGTAAPLCGFTIGLQNHIPGAEAMEPLAPTLMLGNALTEQGRPHRGLMYLKDVWRNMAVPARRVGAARFGTDAAVATGDLDWAVRFGIEALSWYWDHPPEASVEPFRQHLLNHDAAAVIDLALDISDSRDAVSRLASACDVVTQSETLTGPIPQLFRATLSAFRDALSADDLEKLEAAFALALDHRALNIARHLCFFFLYRYGTGRPVQEQDYFVWEWRLVWLTREAGSHDAAFLTNWVAQQRQLFERLTETSDSAWMVSGLAALTADTEGAEQTVDRFLHDLSRHAAGVCGTTRLVQETAWQIRTARRLDFTESAQDAILFRFVDTLFSPIWDSFIDRLREDFTALQEAVQSRAPEEGELREWLSVISTIERVIALVDHPEKTEGVCEYLLQLESMLPRLHEASQARYYVWLRHTLAAIATQPELSSEVIRVITQPRVETLLAATGIPEYLRIRLSTAHFALKGFREVTALAEANLHKQPDTNSLIISPLNEFRERMRNSLDVINECLAQLASNSSTLDELKSNQFDLWNAHMDRGLLQTLGVAALHQTDKYQEQINNWRSGAVEDFYAAMLLARELPEENRVQLRIKTVLEGKAAADAAGDKVTAAEFESEIETFRRNPSYADLLATAEQQQRQSLLAGENSESRAEKLLREGNEVTIQQLTDHVMVSLRCSAGRRTHVEDDVRKLVRTKAAQWEYCRYLEPLQSEEHLRSPLTTYARPTRYTCSCRLLGYETVIEIEDVEVAIDAMKRMYCEGCSQRAPLCEPENSPG